MLPGLIESRAISNANTECHGQKQPKTRLLQNLRQDLSGNVDAMLQFTDKGFCRVILSPESRASCNAAFIESFQLPSSPSIAPG